MAFMFSLTSCVSERVKGEYFMHFKREMSQKQVLNILQNHDDYNDTYLEEEIFSYDI